MRNDQKSIEFTLFTYMNLNDKDLGAKILSVLFDQGHDYAPEKVDYGKKWVAINRDNYSSLLENWRKVYNILFRKESKYKSEIAFFLGNLSSAPNSMSCWVEESFFNDTNNTKIFLETSKLFYDLLHPHYGLIHSTDDKVEMATIKDPKYGKTVLPIDLVRGIPGIYWANFFGPKYVEKLGRSKLILAPCYMIEELKDGGFLFLTGPTPLVSQNADIFTKRKELKEYFGKEYFYP